MNTVQIREYKKDLKITGIQHEIIIGSLLGDGHLELAYRYPRLRIEHSIKQKDYVDWKYKQLKPLVWSAPKEKRLPGRASYSFTTLTLHQLQWYYEKFGKRKLPFNLKRHLSPLVLAVWFMDDGSVKSKQCKGLYLQTQAYTSQKLMIIKNVLRCRYGIESTVAQDNRLYFPSKTGATKLREIVAPYVISCMQYKVNVNRMPKE